MRCLLAPQLRSPSAEPSPIPLVADGAHANIFGKTNVPEFACSLITANYANGRSLNPYDHRLITCGSSGGAASAVASHLAPIALSEDTAGSTRCPALHQNNFGYDPVRNHYNNDGNPGLSYSNDQLGLIARSLEDILIFDAALLGTAVMHAAAARDAPAAQAVRVGTPRRPYLERHVSRGRVLRATASVEERLLRVERVLSAVRVPIVAAEWRCGREPIESTAGGGTPIWYTSLGQMSTYIHDQLEADVSSVSVMADIQTMGASHNPKACFARAARSGTHVESAYRRFMASLPDVLRCYNSIFDENRLDLLLLPAQLSDAVSYTDAANATVRVRLNATNKTVYTTLGGATTWNFWKMIPVPKLLVPTGLDKRGRPTGVMLFGKGPPPNQMFNDTFATTFDLPFLYAAKAVVEALFESDPGLRRAHAPLVHDLFETVEGRAA